MTEPKPLILNLFEMACVSHITHGLWPLPGQQPPPVRRPRATGPSSPRSSRTAASTRVFLADVIGAYDVFRGGPETALREGLQSPNLDPLLLVPAMAAVTEAARLRRDLLDDLRAAVRVRAPGVDARPPHEGPGRLEHRDLATCRTPPATSASTARSPHDRRYELADEYLDVLYKLWEGSWDDDAVVVRPRDGDRDRPGEGALHRPRRRAHRVAGPHIVHPSPQRTPVLFQATGSPAGTEFAGRHAEVVFTGGRTTRGVPQRRQAVDAGSPRCATAARPTT